MHTTAIHRAVEHQLGRSVNYRTVKACLSNETKAKRPRFERVAYGEYRFGPDPGESTKWKLGSGHEVDAPSGERGRER